MKKLTPEALRFECDTANFDFKTTEDIENPTTVIGQDRLSSSMKFGVGMDRKGYNIFALGPNKTDKLGHIKQFLQKKAKESETPSDLCYVNNFEDEYKPHVLKLPAGRGCELMNRMDKLLEDLIPTLNSAFETEEYQNRRQALKEDVQQQQDQTFEDLQQKARDKGLALIRTPSGFSFAPLKDGELMSEQQMQELSEEEREELEEKTKELQKELQKIIQQMPSQKRKVRERLKELDREIASYALKELFRDIREDFSDQENVIEFLDEVVNDIIENVQNILSGGQQGGVAQLMGGQQQQQTGSEAAPKDHPILQRYRVNVIVDHEETEGAPVVYENNPNYKNLIGRVEYQSRMGALTTNFNLIKPGALHKAHGGYLILDARRLMLEPFAWEGLKRALKSGELKIESFAESYRMISTVSLEPEAIDLDVKVVLLGERMLYYLLHEYDPDFASLFKVEADFEDEIDRNDGNQQVYSRLLAGIIENNELRHFDKNAVARVIERSARLVGDNEKMSARTEEISELLEEADHWAGENGHDVVTEEDVKKAIEERIYRSSRLRDKVQESINREFIFIDTEGEAVGQVNGLSVSRIGNLMFGRPNRITARVQLGKGEITDIEREVEMSGPIHSKGVMILKGFLGERYGKDRPLALSASLVFEQSYSKLDGDSASTAELYALLSAIGEIPLKQSFSVTGSVNQHGKVQPIGGVNEKIEGFFDICKERGLTGEQGVIIPASNRKNLMLREDVIDAVKADQFHIYTVETIDEGMELLTGMEMGEPDKEGNYPEGTINHKIAGNLNEMARKRKSFTTSKDGREKEQT
ncbi:MAG: ATP-binding protein [Balneolaceae bacterium]|nr:ATP-binding protein [Balneolaceae bacterium]